MLDQDCGTLYLSLTKCKSDTILLDGLTDPVAVEYIFLKVEIYNFMFAGFPCESKDVVTFLVQPQVSLLSLLQEQFGAVSQQLITHSHILLVRAARQFKPVSEEQVVKRQFTASSSKVLC